MIFTYFAVRFQIYDHRIPQFLYQNYHHRPKTIYQEIYLFYYQFPGIFVLNWFCRHLPLKDLHFRLNSSYF